MRQVFETLEKLSYLHEFGLNLFKDDELEQIDNDLSWVDCKTLSQAYSLRKRVGRKNFAKYVFELAKVRWVDDTIKLVYEKGRYPIIYSSNYYTGDWGRTTPMKEMCYLLYWQDGGNTIERLEKLAFGDK